MAVDSKQLQGIQRGAGVICSTLQFSDHWLCLFPLTLSVPYENKKVERKRDFIERSSAIFETDRPVSNFDDERERLFAKIGRLEMELTG
jgi:hypothetical protein